jgi:hypothetical protein
MPHSFISASSMSGKTTLCQKISESYRKEGFGIIVYDPMDDPSWDCDRLFTNFDEFLKCAYKATRCVLFIEEVGQVIGQYPKPETEWLGTRCRHWGHRSFFIGQSPVQISLTMREQCETLFLFRCFKDRAKKWAEEFIDDDLLKATELQRYEFIQKTRFQPCKTLKLKI